MSTAAAGAYVPPAEGKTSLPGLTGWVLFDWSTQPFYTLISTFLFAPYFTGVFVGEPHGAALWGYIVYGQLQAAPAGNAPIAVEKK